MPGHQTALYCRILILRWLQNNNLEIVIKMTKYFLAKEVRKQAGPIFVYQSMQTIMKRNAK